MGNGLGTEISREIDIQQGGFHMVDEDEGGESEETIDAFIRETWDKDDIKKLKEDIEEASVEDSPGRDLRGGNIEVVTQLAHVPIDLIFGNEEQPRLILFSSEEELEELVASIKKHGNVLEPLLLFPVEGGFKIISGHRRRFAGKKAGIKKLLSIVGYKRNKTTKEIVPLSKSDLLELSYDTNQRRRPMSPIEEALTFQKWMNLTGKNQAALAKRFCKKSSDVSNTLKLLKLTPDLQNDLLHGKISKILGQHLGSWPRDKQDLLTNRYHEILKDFGNKIPSTNASAWVARTLRKIAEEEGIEPLIPKKGKKLRTHTQLVLSVSSDAVGRFDAQLNELAGLSAKNILDNQSAFRQLSSDLGLLLERIEDSKFRIDGEISSDYRSEMIIQDLLRTIEKLGHRIAAVKEDKSVFENTDKCGINKVCSALDGIIKSAQDLSINLSC